MSTILVTGASGFIAKHIVLQLLEAGHAVRASVRSARRKQEAIDAVAGAIGDRGALERLAFVELDLESDRGWNEALSGTDALVHTASPFPALPPRDAQQLIRPAVDGALRALKAAHANRVRRVVMTSSVVAVTRKPLAPGRNAYDESDWSDLEGTKISDYGRSKTLAERAAWSFVEGAGSGIELTTINPGFVLGPPLDRHFGTSLGVVQRMLAGKDPAVPQVGFPVVDVRDVAAAHVRALARPASIGKRIIAASDFLWFADMARALKQAFPQRRIVTRVAPNMLIRLIGLFDKSVAIITPELGERADVDNRRAREILGIQFIDPRRSVVEAVQYLVEHKLA